ncbi:putative HTH-type transcriptional regulator [Nocardia cerradoensis]|uniref:Putative HTH-type transcriptional regulator n=1 Tax=Nocardia cerradoensis TaxID=85688 RepID=A0A231GV54_9NOCA|nr:TetR/AcrR family transcriptional regulator [Nocardia cerradoensis]OXR40361.1 putative HTH-type transcriptional regulator [Nocardia cerradoensis]
MTSRDWLIGRDRGSEASERIYAAAAELIARDGFDKFSIDALARKIHCSPATIYRHAGGKAAIREVVLTLFSARIVELVRSSIDDLDGTDRIVTAIVVSLERIRSDPLGPMMMHAMMNKHEGEWLIESTIVEGLAQQMLGRPMREPAAAQWLVRVVFALWRWPIKDPDTEYDMIRQFIAPGFSKSI